MVAQPPAIVCKGDGMLWLRCFGGFGSYEQPPCLSVPNHWPGNMLHVTPSLKILICCVNSDFMLLAA